AAKASSTNYVNTTSTPVNTAGTTVTSVSPSRNIPSLEDIYEVPNDGIFTSASYDDEAALVQGRKDGRQHLLQLNSSLLQSKQREDKKAKTRLNIEKGNFNKLDDLVGEGADSGVNKGRSTNKIKVLNAKAERVSVAGETLSTATLAVSTVSI
nr:hypothetical protein [Tanacetum cinerariifolium]